MIRDELQGRQLLALGLASESQLAALWPHCQPQRDLLFHAVGQGLVEAEQAEGLRALLARGPFEGLLPLRELNRGGMGVLYEALELASGRRVVIKQILGEADDAAQLRFRREAQALAKVQHPNVVRVLGFGEGRGGPYFTQERIEGEVLSEATSLAEDELRRIGLALCDALDAVHSVGLIHRDVKPDNVMIEAGTGRIVLLDFGLARAHQPRREGETIEQRLTLTCDELGTPAFMAPEQFDSQTFGAPEARTDVWGICATLAAAWRGVPPMGFSAWAWDATQGSGSPGLYALDGRLGGLMLRGLRAAPGERVTLSELRRGLSGQQPRSLPTKSIALTCGLVAAALTVGLFWAEVDVSRTGPGARGQRRRRRPQAAAPEPAPTAPETPRCPVEARRLASALVDLRRWRALNDLEKRAVELWALAQLEPAFGVELRVLPGGGDAREAWVAVHATGIALRLIPGGRMTLGTTESQAELRRRLAAEHGRGDPSADVDAVIHSLDGRMRVRERPAITLEVPPLLVAIYETSWAEYAAGSAKASARRSDEPVSGLSWASASEWCERQPGGLRLPWSAEWEFAAACGDDRIFPWGDAFDPSRLWCAERFGDDAPRAARRRDTPLAHANDFGLYDLAGGVWEWNADSELAPRSPEEPLQPSGKSYSGLRLVLASLRARRGREVRIAYEGWSRFGEQQAHLVRGGGYERHSPLDFVIEEKTFVPNDARHTLLENTGFRVVASLPDAVLDVIYEEDE